MKYPLFYSLPPAGNKIPISILIRSLKWIWGSLNGTFEDSLKSYLGVENILYLSSGRASLWVILKTLSRIRPGKNEVIIPAYTCPAVISSVLKAYLKPVLCDINLRDFGFNIEDLKQKITSNTLSAIVVHLFGYPANIEEVKEVCGEKKIFVIEDAAQAFGNKITEERLGLMGDAGFFSFGRGKPFSILHGGLLVTKSEGIYRIAKGIYKDLHGPARFGNLKYVVSLISYNLFSNPYLYWIPQHIPSLHLGETIFEPEFNTAQGLKSTTSFFKEITALVEKEKEIRRRNSWWYSTHLREFDFIQIPEVGEYPYLRYPILIKNRVLRDKILQNLVHRGTGATLFYPCPLNELSGLKEILKDLNTYPNAKELSDRLITLPVHSGVSTSNLEKIVQIIKKLVY